MNIKIKIWLLTIALAMSTAMQGQNFNPADPPEPTEPVAPPVSLVVQASPTEGGTVTGAGKYNIGSNATVKATASTGFVFSHWTDAQGDTVAVTSSYTLKKGPRVETLTAHFIFNPSAPTEPSEPVLPEKPVVIPVYTLVLVATEGGTVSGAGDYAEGKSVTVKATPSTGFYFTAWLNEAGDTLSTTASFSHTKKAETETLTAHFAFSPSAPGEPAEPVLPEKPVVVPTYTLTLVATEGGTVTGAGDYAEGKSVTVKATPSTGFYFTAWLNEAGDTVSTTASFSHTKRAETETLTAHFRFDPSAPSEPAQPSVSKNSLYLMTVSAKPGDDAECSVYFNAIKEVTDMTFQLGFPSGTTPLPDSLAISDRAAGYSVDYTMVNDSTIVLNVTGGTLPVGNIKLLTMDLRVPEDFPVGTGYVITVNQVSVTLPSGNTETTSTRNSSLDVYKYGDADNSGEIDLVDLIMARDYLYGILIDGFKPVAVDLNRNGIVDTRDIELLTQLILNREP